MCMHTALLQVHNPMVHRSKEKTHQPLKIHSKLRKGKVSYPPTTTRFIQTHGHVCRQAHIQHDCKGFFFPQFFKKLPQTVN